MFILKCEFEAIKLCNLKIIRFFSHFKIEVFNIGI